jgi:hypothetical protein
MNCTNTESHRPQIQRHGLRETRKEGTAKREAHAGRFSVVPLLLGNRDISPETQRALIDNRLQDAAQLLMQDHGLSCIEAGHLLDVRAC